MKFILSFIFCITVVIAQNPVTQIDSVTGLPVTLNEIIVTGEKGSDNPGFGKKIDLSGGFGGYYNSLEEVVNGNFSVFVKDYGGAASAKLLSYRGLSSENSLVLFNGARMNDLRYGGFDLSAFSMSDISSAEFSSSYSASGDISTGGVLSLESRGEKSNGLKFTQKFDNTGLSSSTINGSLTTGNLQVSVAGERMWSANRFDYEFEGKINERENAHYNKTFASVSAIYTFKDFVADIYSNYSFFAAGVPGFVVTNNTSSSQASNTTTGSLSVLRLTGPLFTNSGFEVVTSYNHQLYKFEDPNVNYYKYLDYDDSKLNTYSINLKAFASFGDIKITSGYGFEKGELRDIKTALSNNRKETSLSRNFHRFSAGFRYSPVILPSIISDFAITGGINADIFSQTGIGSNDESRTSYSAGVFVSPTFYTPLSVKAHLYKTTRIPSFNEYYYSSVFSASDIRPERSTGFEAGIVIDDIKIVKGEVSLVYFRIETEDKIIWVPSMIALQVPRNIAKTVSSGLEFGISISILSDAVVVTGNYVYLDAENISPFGTTDKSNGKQLLYSPEHRVNSSITYKTGGLAITMGNRISSESYFTFDNDPLSTIAGNSVFDFKTEYRFNFFNVGQTASLSVYNLFNENYRIIQSYPMPLRTFIFLTH
ncbi:MAG: TonB-dependent receptor plug domain-containing protein [Ignavibacteriales bacterium]|nr:TonB-dependent receptor plug domain-containing protein [Ignavibacteriales bacterium]